MAPTIQRHTTPLTDIDPGSIIDGPIVFWEQVVRLEQIQLETLASLEPGFARLNRDAWDRWVCRFAGGVPIQ